MYAFSPWSGNYTINPALWTTAHWTQFISIGWELLTSGSPGGSGMLGDGGSYVAAQSPSKDDFSLVLETLHGNCLRCTGNDAKAQTVVFDLKNFPAAPPGKVLNVWSTNETHYFIPLPPISVSPTGSLTVSIAADAMLTLTTITTGNHGTFPPAPPDAPFPLPYSDDFTTGYAYDNLPRFFADQAGSFAVRNGALEQVSPMDPGKNGWVTDRRPTSVVGDNAWTDVEVRVSARFSGDPAHGSPATTAGGEAARWGGSDADPVTLSPCPSPGTPTPPAQSWKFGAVAEGYLSDSPAPAPTDAPVCLNVPGCDTSSPLVTYQCVTSGGTCGGASDYSNLQFDFHPSNGTLTSRMPHGGPTPLCVQAPSSNSVNLATCREGGGASGQVWTYNEGSSGTLRVSPSDGSGEKCLTGPLPAPAEAPYTQLCIRASDYDTFGNKAVNALCLQVASLGNWTMLSGPKILGAGFLGGGFNSSTWHTLGLRAKGQNISASVDGQGIWSGGGDGKMNGQVVIGSGYHSASWDNFSVLPAA